MVPISLRLRNFLCYRDNVPVLPFSGFRVACLSGSNGHGKSALLDAMSWALWGQARAKGNEDLVYHGQSEMEVDFEFSMGTERYRVIRKYSRPKTRAGAGQTVLELQVENAGDYRPITGNTLRETEQKIVDLLHLDYETFINSSCLLQGRADEFTMKRAGDRKRILADILNLGAYDRLEERAKVARDDWQQTIRTLEEEIAAIDREVGGREALVAEEAKVAAELERLELLQRTGQAELQVAEADQRQRATDRQRQQEIEVRLKSLRADLTRLQGEATRTQTKIEQCEQVIVRATAIEAAYQEFLRRQTELGAWTVRQGEHQRLSTERQQLGHRIELARKGLEGELRAAQQTATRYRGRAEQLPLALQREAELTIREADLGRAVAELEADRADLGRLIETRQAHQLEKERLLREMEDLRKRVDLLASPDDSCWLCGHELGAGGKAHLQEVCRQDGLERKEQYRHHEKAARDLAGRIKPVEAERETRQRQIQAEQAAFQTERGRLTQQIEQCREAREALEKAEADLTLVGQALAAADYAVAERARLAVIETELAGLAYDPPAHESVRKRLTELGAAEREHWVLEQAHGAIAAERQALTGQQATIVEREREIAAAQEALQAIGISLAGYPDLDALIAERLAALRAADTAAGRTREELGGIRQQIQAADTLAARRPAKEQELKAARLEKSLRDDLVTAFGRRGIQAMIIDAVLPEIEEEANQLLARMTDNRMHVSFETQRETRKGGAVETLDIRVADELGTRPYELFSGGEAFRINFAVRIALSRLLARRAGARLQTLIIDEGFGTQDASGREKLVEAINSVQGDFEKILVITHVDELKDLFTTRIDVVKGEFGSIAQVA